MDINGHHYFMDDEAEIVCQLLSLSDKVVLDEYQGGTPLQFDYGYSRALSGWPVRYSTEEHVTNACPIGKSAGLSRRKCIQERTAWSSKSKEREKTTAKRKPLIHMINTSDQNPNQASSYVFCHSVDASAYIDNYRTVKENARSRANSSVSLSDRQIVKQFTGLPTSQIMLNSPDVIKRPTNSLYSTQSMHSQKAKRAQSFEHPEDYIVCLPSKVVGYDWSSFGNKTTQKMPAGVEHNSSMIRSSAQHRLQKKAVRTDLSFTAKDLCVKGIGERQRTSKSRESKLIFDSVGHRNDLAGYNEDHIVALQQSSNAKSGFDIPVNDAIRENSNSKINSAQLRHVMNKIRSSRKVHNQVCTLARNSLSVTS